VKAGPAKAMMLPMICMARTETDLPCAASRSKTSIWPVLTENTSGYYVALDHGHELAAGSARRDHVDRAAGVVSAALPPILLAFV